MITPAMSMWISTEVSTAVEISDAGLVALLREKSHELARVATERTAQYSDVDPYDL